LYQRRSNYSNHSKIYRPKYHHL